MFEDSSNLQLAFWRYSILQNTVLWETDWRDHKIQSRSHQEPFNSISNFLERRNKPCSWRSAARKPLFKWTLCIGVMQGSMAALINRGRGNEKNKPICCQWRERERERERELTTTTPSCCCCRGLEPSSWEKSCKQRCKLRKNSIVHRRWRIGKS